MVKIKNIMKRYNDEIALNDVSLTIKSGINFIVGASGSGKSTLLKIISGIEKDFEGEVYYNDINISKLDEKERSYFYNNIIGFIWQDFNLLEELTVMENILLPTQLKERINKDYIEKILTELKLNNLRDKLVKELSGGQKQRVAIARELMKCPQIIIADEPTSALDKETAKEIIEILRKISKNRTVIIVTHDVSHITEEDSVYELDKGELIFVKDNNKVKEEKITIKDRNTVSFKNIKNIIKMNIGKHKGRFITSTISIMLGICLLLTTVSGSIKDNSQKAFDELFANYGDSILDISLYHSFISAAGTGDGGGDEPNADVDQDISGFYDKYVNDERVQFVTFVQAFNDIKINVDGKSYSIKNSGNTPSINKIITGRMANGTENEVVVPESFVKKMKITPEEAINKEITFNGDIIKWINDTPISVNTETKAKIVGVMDTSIFYEYEGKIYKTPIEDSFMFSKSALSEMLNKANMDMSNTNFLIRAKTPKDTIEIKNELNKEGIVPLGRFELIEDLVKLNEQSENQSSFGNNTIVILTIIMVIAIFITTNIMRRREYTIFKISGFSNRDLRKINIIEILTELIIAVVMMIVLSPLLNIITKSIFNTKILTFATMGTSLLIGLGIAIIIYIITEIICDTTNINRILKTGEKE